MLMCCITMNQHDSVDPPFFFDGEVGAYNELQDWNGLDYELLESTGQERKELENLRTPIWEQNEIVYEF